MANKRAEIAKIYGRLPSINCKGLCWKECRPLLATKTERAQMIEAGGEPVSHGDQCAFLSEDHQCTIYQARPLICRLYALDDTLICPHGCELEGTRLTAAEAHELIAKLAALDGAYLPVEEPSMEEFDERMRGIAERNRSSGD